MVTKGALSNVLSVCTAAEQPGGRLCPMEEARGQVLERYDALSRQGYRCLGVAYRILDSEATIRTESEREMVFLGLLNFSDPLKAGALESLQRLRGLGISVKLISGDNRTVAAKIGREAGLNVRTILTGAELRHLTDSALIRRAARVDVFAEVEPHQKERIVLALKKGGRAVGYLGDGINDASALHAADVGISVDTAVEVTKQAADIVLLRKDLGVLAEGVREGRRAFANTLKYVFITTSANFGNMFSMAGSASAAAAGRRKTARPPPSRADRFLPSCCLSSRRYSRSTWSPPRSRSGGSITLCTCKAAAWSEVGTFLEKTMAGESEGRSRAVMRFHVGGGSFDNQAPDRYNRLQVIGE